MDEKEKKPVVKTKKKFAMALATFGVAAAIVVGSFFGLNAKKERENKQPNLRKPGVTTTGERPDYYSDYETQENVISNELQSSINSAICENVGYENFDYKYVAYRHNGDTYALQINGTTQKGGEMVFSSISYDIDAETYRSFVGYNLNVSKDTSGKYLVVNDNSGISEEEELVVNSLIEAYAESKPASVKEMTYEENLVNVAKYLTEKDGQIILNGLDYYSQDSVSQKFSSILYFCSGIDGDMLVFNTYNLYVEQLKDYMIKNIDESGKTVYKMIPDKNSIDVVGFYSKAENERLSVSEYLDLYINYNGEDKAVFDCIKSHYLIKNGFNNQIAKSEYQR